MSESDECIHGLAHGTCSLCSPRSTQVFERTALSKSGRTMDILVKWNPTLDEATFDRHWRTAKEQGTTWWGCWSEDGERHVSAERLRTLERQLRLKVPTDVYLYRLGPQEDVWQARLVALSDDETAIDRNRRPAGMSSEQCFLFLELTDFAQIESDWPQNHLKRWDAPRAGHVTWKGLHNQTSPMYVFKSE